ncbi:MAG: TrmH family RNA methyltransferase [Desulfovibrionaceae bacterium]
MASAALLRVVMVKTRFPENVGMAARACANMGADEIVLVDPELWHIDKARPLATAKGQTLLEAVRLVPTLAEALTGTSLVLGTTARTGGWRREWLTPESAAGEVAAVLAEQAAVAVVFGPEDRGLDNDEVELCHRLVTIPTVPGVSSLNVAQALLLVLYECHKARTAGQGHKGSPLPNSRRMNTEEGERLTSTLKDTLLQLDYLHGDNPDYFMMPFRRFLGRFPLRRHEYDTLMGICRQIRYKLGLRKEP